MAVDIFESGKKKLQIKKYPDTFERGLKRTVSFKFRYIHVHMYV